VTGDSPDPLLLRFPFAPDLRLRAGDVLQTDEEFVIFVVCYAY